MTPVRRGVRRTSVQRSWASSPRAAGTRPCSRRSPPATPTLIPTAMTRRRASPRWTSTAYSHPCVIRTSRARERSSFCGAKDQELALLCVRAYNDFVCEEWAGGCAWPIHSCGHLAPCGDPVAGAAEIDRCAAVGASAVCFSENPSNIGLPSIHDGLDYWEPIFSAASEAGMPIGIHVAPTLMAWRAADTAVDWVSLRRSLASRSCGSASPKAGSAGCPS